MIARSMASAPTSETSSSLPNAPAAIVNAKTPTWRGSRAVSANAAPPVPFLPRFRSGPSPNPRTIRSRRARPAPPRIPASMPDRREWPTPPGVGRDSRSGSPPARRPVMSVGIIHAHPAEDRLRSRPPRPRPARLIARRPTASPAPASAAAVANRSDRSRSSSVIANRAASRNRCASGGRSDSG